MLAPSSSLSHPRPSDATHGQCFLSLFLCLTSISVALFASACFIGDNLRSHNLELQPRCAGRWLSGPTRERPSRQPSESRSSVDRCPLPYASSRGTFARFCALTFAGPIQTPTWPATCFHDKRPPG